MDGGLAIVRVKPPGAGGGGGEADTATKSSPLLVTDKPNNGNGQNIFAHGKNFYEKLLFL